LIFFSRYINSQAYFDLTVETTAKAIHHKNQAATAATVIVGRLERP